MITQRVRSKTPRLPKRDQKVDERRELFFAKPSLIAWHHIGLPEYKLGRWIKDATHEIIAIGDELASAFKPPHLPDEPEHRATRLIDAADIMASRAAMIAKERGAPGPGVHPERRLDGALGRIGALNLAASLKKNGD